MDKFIQAAIVEARIGEASRLARSIVHQGRIIGRGQ
jgi:hypothetical protein